MKTTSRRMHASCSLDKQGQKQYLYVRAPKPNDTTGNLRTSSCCRILETSSPTPLHIFEPPHPTTKVKDLKPMLNIKKEIWSRRLELMLWCMLCKASTDAERERERTIVDVKICMVEAMMSNAVHPKNQESIRNNAHQQPMWSSISTVFFMPAHGNHRAHRTPPVRRAPPSNRRKVEYLSTLES